MTITSDRTLPMPGQVLMAVEELDNYAEDAARHATTNLDDAKVTTSLVAEQRPDGPRMHRPVLDVDYPVTVDPLGGGRTRLRIDTGLPLTDDHRATLHLGMIRAGITRAGTQPHPGPDIVLDVDRPVLVLPSSTPGHHHLYIDRRMTWRRYSRLLDLLVDVDVLEPGYVAAAESRGHTPVRLPWVRKPEPDPTRPTCRVFTNDDPWA